MYQPVPPFTIPVPPSTNQYRLLLTHYHHIFYSNVRLSFVDLRGAQLYVSLVCGFSLNCDLRVSIYSIQKGGGKAQDFQFFLNDNCDFYISIHFRHWSGNLYCCVCVVGLRSTLPLLHLETNFKCRWDHLPDLQKVSPLCTLKTFLLSSQKVSWDLGLSSASLQHHKADPERVSKLVLLLPGIEGWRQLHWVGRRTPRRSHGVARQLDNHRWQHRCELSWDKCGWRNLLCSWLHSQFIQINPSRNSGNKTMAICHTKAPIIISGGKTQLPLWSVFPSVIPNHRDRRTDCFIINLFIENRPYLLQRQSWRSWKHQVFLKRYKTKLNVFRNPFTMTGAAINTVEQRK